MQKTSVSGSCSCDEPAKLLLYDWAAAYLLQVNGATNSADSSFLTTSLVMVADNDAARLSPRSETSVEWRLEFRCPFWRARHRWSIARKLMEYSCL